jgi:hypothetical protein
MDCQEVISYLGDHNIKWNRPVIVARQCVRLTALILLLTTIGCGSYSPFYDLIPAERIHVSIPNGYEGRIMIAWEVPDGEVSEKEEGVWQYRLQKDGALLLQNDFPQVVSWSFSYERPDGSQEPLLQSTCFEDAPEEGVVICTGGWLQTFDTVELRPNTGFTVTTIDDYLNGRWEGEEFFGLFRRYLDRLALPDEEES